MDYSSPVSSVTRISWQDYWSGLPFPSLGDPHDPGIKHECPAFADGSLPLSH